MANVLVVRTFPDAYRATGVEIAQEPIGRGTYAPWRTHQARRRLILRKKHMVSTVGIRISTPQYRRNAWNRTPMAIYQAGRNGRDPTKGCYSWRCLSSGQQSRNRPTICGIVGRQHPSISSLATCDAGRAAILFIRCGSYAYRDGS